MPDILTLDDDVIRDPVCANCGEAKDEHVLRGAVVAPILACPPSVYVPAPEGG